jgi:hypothetical protein
VQMVHGLNLPDSRILFLESPQGRCLVDTCPDITLARLDVMVNVRVVDPVTVGHLGGETRLRRAWDFTLGGSTPNSNVDLVRIFGVEHYELPAGVIALLGMGEVRRLGLSLDYIRDHPGCYWDAAIRFPSYVVKAGCWRRLWLRCFGRPSQVVRESVPAALPYRLHQDDEVRPEFVGIPEKETLLRPPPPQWSGPIAEEETLVRPGPPLWSRPIAPLICPRSLDDEVDRELRRTKALLQEELRRRAA